MILQAQKFGKILSSRPAGREAGLVAKSYLLPADLAGEFVIDFEEVAVLSPSWLDEFIQEINNYRPGLKIKYINTANPSVNATIEMLKEIKG
ncbi:DUF4325 domain-containing protein [Candidatus Saganbacteria bacterium]|nr:DUF4325 domain-containing protein [Candidatus Saganbacteria bacterium]